MAGVARRTYPVAGLLLGSGTCALIYQVAWMREFRHIFGASTAATAAVLAIFIAGLGAGGIVIGKRADTHRRPLQLYANLEMLIAICAAATPLLFAAARWLYVTLGGSPAMGTGLATIVRLILATLILAAPTFLMGGTLPAAARAVETDDDQGRAGVSLLYGCNTLGAVTGCVLATFVLLEALGIRLTLWAACACNIGVALMARWLSRRWGDVPAETRSKSDDKARGAGDISGSAPAPAPFVLGAAALVGLAFFLMELVWYRMLAPLLGGTVFTFGLILAVALLGIGLGGIYYALVGKNRPATIAGFAYTCLLEAVFIALPFALGDRIAIMAAMIRPLGVTGLLGFIGAWSVVTVMVVLPAAFVSGVQFPMLIALLGKGRTDVGREVGLAYAWNTGGAIVGSLAGGFGLMPALTATGCWKLGGLMLGLLGLGAMVVSARREKAWSRLAPPAIAAATVVVLLCQTGPTAAWRHAPIGAGRVPPMTDPSQIRDWTNMQRRIIVWSSEGVESSVAVTGQEGYAFIQNGKSDGSARSDAGTQIMLGLLGALFHPDPQRALVVGLGTGSTAGWLGAIPEMQRVDVVELERSILHVAKLSQPVNHDALANPKVHIRIGDAREVLLTTSSRYDIIVSEPSNPYRSGVCSLFTQEFYEAVADRLNPGGIFVQWIQAYEVDGQTLRTSIATLTSVFPNIEAYTSQSNDVLFLASMEPLPYEVARLRQRLASDPWKTAQPRVWRTWDLEGVLARRLAGNATLRSLARVERGRVNTDDHNLVEFGFARSVGAASLALTAELISLARSRKDDKPTLTGGDVDWTLVERHHAALNATQEALSQPERWWTPEQSQLGAMYDAYTRHSNTEALAMWRQLNLEPRSLLDVELLAAGLAEAGDDAALTHIETVRTLIPAEALILQAALRGRQNRPSDAVKLLAEAFVAMRTEPWVAPGVLAHSLDMARGMARIDRASAEQLFAALHDPFAIHLADAQRAQVWFELLDQIDAGAHCVEVMNYFEPNVPWNEEFLNKRAHCYQMAKDRRLERARSELNEFRSMKRSRLVPSAGTTGNL